MNNNNYTKMADFHEDSGAPSTLGINTLPRPKRICRNKFVRNIQEIEELLDESDIDLSDEDDLWLPEEERRDLPHQESYCSSESEDIEDDLPLSKLNKRTNNIFWLKTNTFNPEIDKSQAIPEYIPDENRLLWKPIDYFKNYFTEDLFQIISDETNRRSVIESGKSLKVTPSEIKKFIGISILTGTLKYPRLKMYWETAYGITLVIDCMTRDRFFKIRGKIKVVNDLDVSEEEKKKDRLWKLRPVIKQIKSKCQSLPRTRALCIDEQMVPFTGRCPLRQHVPNKPHPVGLKIFVLATPQGLIINFEIYQGKGSLMFESAVDVGVGGGAVLHLVKILSPGHSLYFDRYFTNIPLLEMLKDKGILSTGTLMKNRIPNSCELNPDKELRKLGRGDSDQVVRSDKKIALVKWMDNKSVTIGSTEYGVEPINNCIRWSKKVKTFIEVTRPASIKEYNEKMGGVDLHDRMISFYPMLYRTKKWTVRLFHHLIDLSLTNAWIEYRTDRQLLYQSRKDILQFLDFRLQVSEDLCRTCNENCGESSDENTENGASNLAADPENRRARSVPVPNIIFRKKGLHIPEFVEMKTANKRCRLPGCKGRPRTKCMRCGVFLCINSNNCFKKFHN